MQQHADMHRLAGYTVVLYWGRVMKNIKVPYRIKIKWCDVMEGAVAALMYVKEKKK